MLTGVYRWLGSRPNSKHRAFLRIDLTVCGRIILILPCSSVLESCQGFSPRMDTSINITAPVICSALDHISSVQGVWVFVRDAITQPPSVAWSDAAALGVPTDAIDDFLSKADKPTLHGSIRQECPTRIYAELLERELDELLTEEGRNCFDEHFPNTLGLIRCSNIGVSADRRHAFLYIEAYSGPLSAQGTFVHLVWDGLSWTVRGRFIDWKA